MPISTITHVCPTTDPSGKTTITFNMGTDPQVIVSVTEDLPGSLFFSLQPASFDGDIADIDGLFFNLTDDSTASSLNFYPDANQLPVTGHSASANSEDSLLSFPNITSGYDGVVNFGLIADTNDGEVPNVNFTLWSNDGPITLDSIDFSNFALVVTNDAGETEVVTANIEIDEGEDILVNGDLDSSVADGTWALNADVQGWTNDNGGIEGWGDGFLGANSVDGGTFIELDRTNTAQLDNLYQDVQTAPHQTYELSFSAMQRGADHDSIEVYWKGELIDTVTPSSNTEWDTYTYTVEGSGGEDRLEFRELASQNDSTGPLMDNISLVEDCQVEHDCGDEVLINGDLDSSVPDGTWRLNADVTGWTNDNGGIEGWGDGFLGVNTPDGGTFIELDRTNAPVADNLYQDVHTEAGQTYEISFSAMQRGADSDSIEVYFKGELLDTVTPSSNTEWDTFTYTVEGSGGDDRLEFRELISENDCTGPLMDNISMVATCPDDHCDEDILVNGDLESSVPDGTWRLNADVAGWTNDNGGIEGWGDGFLGVNTEDGGTFVELDRTNAPNVDNLYQDVETEAGQSYNLSFSALQRGADSDSIEVYWKGELIDTVIPSSNTDWETFSYTVEGSGGTDRLEFRELASENDCTGPLMDNISLVVECAPQDAWDIPTVSVPEDDPSLTQEADKGDDELVLEMI